MVTCQKWTSPPPKFPKFGGQEFNRGKPLDPSGLTCNSQQPAKEREVIHIVLLRKTLSCCVRRSIHPMSRQSMSSSRPPAPAPPDEAGDDGPPPVPKPRAGPRGGAARRANLPVWPPPGVGAAQGSPSLPKAPSRGTGGEQQRAPAPLPPSSPPVPPPSPPGAHSRSPAPPPSHFQQPQLPPPRVSLAASPGPPLPPSSSSSRHHTPLPPSSGGKDGFAFGTCLQEAHDAINKRHEEELHALESFRAHVFFRARADREYAQELAKINSRANKTLSTVSQSSAIVQVTV